MVFTSYAYTVSSCFDVSFLSFNTLSSRSLYLRGQCDTVPRLQKAISYLFIVCTSNIFHLPYNCTATIEDYSRWFLSHCLEFQSQTWSVQLTHNSNTRAAYCMSSSSSPNRGLHLYLAMNFRWRPLPVTMKMRGYIDEEHCHETALVPTSYNVASPRMARGYH